MPATGFGNGVVQAEIVIPTGNCLRTSGAWIEPRLEVRLSPSKGAAMASATGFCCIAITAGTAISFLTRKLPILHLTRLVGWRTTFRSNTIFLTMILTFRLWSTLNRRKECVEHGNQLRYYHYRLYQAVVKRMPEQWKSLSFKISGGKECRWLSVDEMFADQRIRQVNGDVVTAVRDYL